MVDGDTLEVGGVRIRLHGVDAPMNRAHCWLHLFRNVVPATRDANRRNAGKHFRELAEGPGRLERIAAFVRESGYAYQMKSDNAHFLTMMDRSLAEA